MFKKVRSLGDSFRYAFRGLSDAVRQEPNLKIHVVLAVLAIFGAVYLRFNIIEFAIVTLTVAMVFVLELTNTTLEALVDLVSPEIHEKARIAKDVSAASVLLAAITSLIIMALLYIPKIFALFAY